MTTQDPALASMIGAVPMRFRVVAAMAAALAVLLIVGVPLSALLPFAGVAACLGMHLFMIHGSHSDGSGHSH